MKTKQTSSKLYVVSTLSVRTQLNSSKLYVVSTLSVRTQQNSNKFHVVSTFSLDYINKDIYLMKLDQVGREVGFDNGELITENIIFGNDMR